MPAKCKQMRGKKVYKVKHRICLVIFYFMWFVNNHPFEHTSLNTPLHKISNPYTPFITLHTTFNLVKNKFATSLYKIGVYEQNKNDSIYMWKTQQHLEYFNVIVKQQDFSKVTS